MVLEKTLECLLDCKEIQPVHSKGDQSWVFIGRIDAKAETPILGNLMRTVGSLEKKKKKTTNPEAERNWGQEEKGFISI